MPSKRLDNIPGFNIDQVAKAAGNDPEVLRLENLDTDLLPPEAAIEATRRAIGRDDDNSYLPFIGQEALRELIARRLSEQTTHKYLPENVVVTCGATEAMLDVLLALIDPGDEVIVTDPTYAGMINRVRLAGGVPRFLPFMPLHGAWRLDVSSLPAMVNSRTRAIFLMNPSMPAGAVLNLFEWEAIAKQCRDHGLWLIYNAAMERILYDKRQVIHPATLPGMAAHTITIGSVSKEYRMIGWRVGWVAAPNGVAEDIAKVHIYNAVSPVGIAQAGALEALKTSPADIQQAVRTWETRRDVVNAQLGEYSMIPAAGGWSQLLDVSPLGMDAPTASKLLLQKGKVAVTPMTHWGRHNSKQFIRLVFSNEPVERLQTLGERFRRALAR